MVRDLVIFVDSNCSMEFHVHRTLSDVSQSYSYCAVFSDQFRCPSRLLIITLVLSWLDYGNATLAHVAFCLLICLQSILNTSARSDAGLRRSVHISDTLVSFHWPTAPERIEFKLEVFVYRVLRGVEPRCRGASGRCYIIDKPPPAVMLSLGLGLGLKTEFFGLGLGLES